MESDQTSESNSSEWDLSEYDPNEIVSRPLLGGDMEVPPLDGTQSPVRTRSLGRKNGGDGSQLHTDSHHTVNLPYGGDMESKPVLSRGSRHRWIVGAVAGLALGAPVGAWMDDGLAPLERIEMNYATHEGSSTWLDVTPSDAVSYADSKIELLTNELINTEEELTEAQRDQSESCQLLLGEYVVGADREDVPPETAIGDIMKEPGQPCGASIGTVREELMSMLELSNLKVGLEADLEGITDIKRQAQAIIEAGPQPDNGKTFGAIAVGFIGLGFGGATGVVLDFIRSRRHLRQSRDQGAL